MLLCPFYAMAIDDSTKSMRISSHGMRLQNERLKIIAENIANANVAPLTPDGTPYRRKILIAKNVYDTNIGANKVTVDKITSDKSDFVLRYEPYHPAANAEGYVKYPNVDIVLENVNAKEAQRTYEANLSAMEITKNNQLRLIEALK
jgi:flagellar basal-body rod protein FlgC